MHRRWGQWAVASHSISYLRLDRIFKNDEQENDEQENDEQENDEQEN
jgi:hypothetical protein